MKLYSSEVCSFSEVETFAELSQKYYVIKLQWMRPNKKYKAHQGVEPKTTTFATHTLLALFGPNIMSNKTSAYSKAHKHDSM